jgi:hypothetical protein
MLIKERSVESIRHKAENLYSTDAELTNHTPLVDQQQKSPSMPATSGQMKS